MSTQIVYAYDTNFQSSFDVSLKKYFLLVIITMFVYLAAYETEC